MRSRIAIIVMLVVLIGFILCLPLLETIDYNDLVLTGQDLELTLLNLLTILAVWFVLILRLLAALPSFRTCFRITIKAPLKGCLTMYRRLPRVHFLPDELSALCDPFPLLI